MVWGDELILLIGLIAGLTHAAQERPGLHHAVASLRQTGQQPTKTDIGNLDLFDPLKDTVEATIAAAISNAKAHPRKDKVAAVKLEEPSVTKIVSDSQMRMTSPHHERQQKIEEPALAASSTLSISHHQSLANKVGQVVSRAATVVKGSSRPVASKKNLPHTDVQKQKDHATSPSVDQARGVKLPIVQEEVVQQNVQVDQEPDASAPEKPDPCAAGVEVAEKVLQALPQIQQQPLWNLIGPDVLHLGEIVDEPLSRVKDSLSPAGDLLLDRFPNLQLRDLPVFCSLPRPFPHNFAWALPLEATASDLTNLFPFHVRNTPLQSLRLEDMLLVGRRQRELLEQDYQQKEKKVGKDCQEE